MRMPFVRCALLSALSVAGVLASSAADALLFRTYLSFNGTDTNPCTVQLPCRLLPKALAEVQAGGEIWMIDSANFNTAPVNVNKSVTILAVPGALGSVVASGGAGLLINTAGVKVTLRNLVLLNFSAGTNGIDFSQGAELTVEDCEIYGMPLSAIFAHAPASTLNVKNTVIRNNGTMGVNLAGTVTATLDRVHLLTNGQYGLGAASGAKATVSNSVIANHTGISNAAGVIVAGGGTTQVAVERSVIRANNFGVLAQTSSAPDIVQLSLIHNSITHNTKGYTASGVASSTITAVIDDNAITHNGTTGVDVAFGAVNTRQNNTFLFNGANTSGSALTNLAGF